MTNPDELQRRFTAPSRSYWIVVVLVLVGVLGIAGWSARPAWRAIKRWRAEQFRDRAEAELAAGRLGPAMDQARSAVQLDPANPATQRLNARLLTRLGNEHSLNVWQRVLNSGEATLDDRLSFAEAALALDRPELVGPLVSNLLATEPASARLHRVGALLHVSGRRFDQALVDVREAIRLEPSNPTNTAMLGTLLAASPGKSNRAEARRVFAGLALTNGPFQLPALQQLVQTDLGERPERERILAYLEGLPRRGPVQEVMLAEVRIMLDPTLEGRTLSNLVAGLTHDDVERLTLVVDVLVRHQRYEDVVRLTLAGRALKNRALLIARHDSLQALGRAEEAYRLLLEPGVPLAPWDLGLARVRAARTAKDDSRLETHLRDLLGEAKANARRIRSVAELAEECRQFGVAKDAWTRLVDDPADGTAALRSLQRLADRTGDTWTARDFARRALRKGATFPNLPLEVAYYDLLLGEDPDRALATAERAFQSNPDDFFARATVALAHLRLGNPAKARSMLDRFVVDGSVLRPDALAVVVATYGANDLGDRAREIAAQIPLSRLRPEERELVRPWLVRPEDSGRPAKDEVRDGPGSREGTASRSP